MAILNFPDNPQTGDLYTGDSGTTYIFDGVKWIGTIIEAGVQIPGQINNSGKLLSTDGTTLTWVSIDGGTATSTF